MMDERRITRQYKDSTIGVAEYRAYGRSEGYPVFFMHGATPLPFSDALIDFIQRSNLYVVTVLRPGYGKSTPRKYTSLFEYMRGLKNIIESLNFRQFDVVSLSAGAPYAYAMASAFLATVAGVHICAGIPLANNRRIFRMFPRSERIMFSLSKRLPPGLMGRYAVKAMEAMERKKGWGEPPCGGSMDEVFENDVRPNWRGVGLSTRLQYRDWGFDAEEITTPVNIYHSKKDEMIPFEIAQASAGLLANCRFVPLENAEHSSEKTVRLALESIAAKKRETEKHS
jgi:pimeloyl-ACP methyl ester carboxylesterase